MKKMKFENLILAALLVFIVFIGQMRISASELHDDSTEENISVSEEVLSEEDQEEVILSKEASEEVTVFEDEEKIETQLEEAAEGDTSYYKGLQYYLNYYKYSCEAKYLQSYLEYLQLSSDICRTMHDAGDMTEADVKICEAEYAMEDARRMQAERECTHYSLYLKEHNRDYSDFKLRESKKVHDAEYYFERYPACDHMTVSRYVTDYKNAISYIEAKKLEVEALQTKLEMDRLLFEEGELSKQAFLEQKLTLAKAEYELELYYIDMNLSWVQLMLYIGQ